MRSVFIHRYWNTKEHRHGPKVIRPSRPSIYPSPNPLPTSSLHHHPKNAIQTHPAASIPSNTLIALKRHSWLPRDHMQRSEGQKTHHLVVLLRISGLRSMVGVFAPCLEWCFVPCESWRCSINIAFYVGSDHTCIFSSFRAQLCSQTRILLYEYKCFRSLVDLEILVRVNQPLPCFGPLIYLNHQNICTSFIWVPSQFLSYVCWLVTVVLT